MRVLTNERYKIYQTGFSFCRLGHVLGGGGLRGAGGCPGVFFSNSVMWHFKSTWMLAEQNANTIFILGQTGDLGVISRGQISLNFGCHVNFKDLYQTLCVFSQIKDRKRIEQNLVFCCPRGGTWGGGGQKL